MIRIFAGIAGIAVLFFTMSAGAAPPTAEDALKDRVLGDPNAPVEIIEYSSLSCQVCRDFQLNVLPKIKKKYIDTGKVRLVYRDFATNRADLMAAVLARCAPPDRYFTFLDVLFQNQDRWLVNTDHATLLARIGRLGGLSEADYRACLSNRAIVDGLVRMRSEANKRFNDDSGLAFVINGDKRVVGFQSFEVFDELLGKLVK